MTVRVLGFIILFCLLQTECFALVKGVIINEFVASNVDGILDEDLDHSDWIELHNNNSVDVNLLGWSLTDNVSEPQKWVFPDISIKAGSYLLVFASEKDRKTVGKELHTNFKLSIEGEYLALFSPDLLAETEFDPYPIQETDFSFSFYNGFWLPFNKPTPRGANDNNAFAQFPTPEFSQNHGFFDHPFVLTITCALHNAIIYYTTDGSIPSSTNGIVYKNSITITETTVLRAIAIDSKTSADRVKDSRVNTRTFLFPVNIINQSNIQPGYPSFWGKYAQISGTSIADYEMDPELMAESKYVEKVLAAYGDLPVVSLVTDRNNLFSSVNDPLTGGIYIYTGPPTGGPGNGWERPASFEYFSAKEAISLQVDCGLQLHGGHSRLPEKSPKHSFRLDFQTEYGPSKLYYPLFGENEAKNINSFFLRAGFGNTWIHQTSSERTKGIYSRDEWAKKTQKRMGYISSNTQYAHLFINGLYWGLYNPNERIDDDFCVTYLGGKKEDYDIIKVEDSPQTVIASNGTIDAWNSLLALVTNSSDPVVFQKILGNNPDGSPNGQYKSLLDLDNFIDYMLINFYAGNADWDNHNWIALQNRVNPGKGFKFLCWDSEHMLKNLSENLLLEDNARCPSRIFQQLRKNALFKRYFADRVQLHCFNNGSLSPEGAADTWTKLADVIDNSIYAESARWGDYRKDVHSYVLGPFYLFRKDVHYDTQKKDLIENFFPKRTDIFLEQLKDAGLFPTVDAPSYRIDGQIAEKDTVNEGSIMTISALQGVIYYTTDGTDPVNWSQNGTGKLSASANIYSKYLEVNNDIRVKSRALSGSLWSALSDKLFIVNKSTGIKDNIEMWSEIKVRNYPNPFQDHTNIEYYLPLKLNVCIEVFDLSGRMVLKTNYENQVEGFHNFELDGSALSKGIYVCKFVVKGSIEHKLVFRISKL